MSRATEFEEMFGSRFSATDEEFQRYRERAADPPPVLEDYRVNRGRGDRRGPEQRQHRQHHYQYQRQRQHHDQYQHHRHRQDQYQYHQHTSGSGGLRPQY